MVDPNVKAIEKAAKEINALKEAVEKTNWELRQMSAVLGKLCVVWQGIANLMDGDDSNEV